MKILSWGSTSEWFAWRHGEKVDMVKYIVYITGTCECSLLWGLNPPKQGPTSNQNKGPHLGSRYVCLYIYYDGRFPWYQVRCANQRLLCFWVFFPPVLTMETRRNTASYPTKVIVRQVLLVKLTPKMSDCTVGCFTLSAWDFCWTRISDYCKKSVDMWNR